jgi:hypothetical protein
MIEGNTKMPSQLGDDTDLDQVIKDAKYARLEFVRKHLRFFAYGSGLLGLLCAFAITVLTVGSANRDQQSMQISHVAKTIREPPSPAP